MGAALLVLFLLKRRRPRSEQGAGATERDSEFTWDTAESVKDSTTDAIMLGEGVGRGLFLRLI
jgi:hypothetical protein